MTVDPCLKDVRRKVESRVRLSFEDGLCSRNRTTSSSSVRWPISSANDTMATLHIIMSIRI